MSVLAGVLPRILELPGVTTGHRRAETTSSIDHNLEKVGNILEKIGGGKSRDGGIFYDTEEKGTEVEEWLQETEKNHRNQVPNV